MVSLSSAAAADRVSNGGRGRPCVSDRAAQCSDWERLLICVEANSGIPCKAPYGASIVHVMLDCTMSVHVTIFGSNLLAATAGVWLVIVDLEASHCFVHRDGSSSVVFIDRCDVRVITHCVTSFIVLELHE